MKQIICDRCKKPIENDVCSAVIRYPWRRFMGSLVGAACGISEARELQRFATGETENHESELQGGKGAGSAGGDYSGGRIGAGSASVGCAENFWSCRMAEQQKIATDFVNGEVRRPEDDVLLSLRWRLKEHVVDFALSRLKELQMAEKEDADNDKT